jgi:putative alpha-1,2-mannosidase
MQGCFVLKYGLAWLSLVPAISNCAQSAPGPYDAVDPLIGASDGGNTFLGASLPFGMMQWSPETNTNAWYFYSEKQIRGFGLTHIGPHRRRRPTVHDTGVHPVVDCLSAIGTEVNRSLVRMSP